MGRVSGGKRGLGQFDLYTFIVANYCSGSLVEVGVSSVPSK
jgi:hypothetical protein